MSKRPDVVRGNLPRRMVALLEPLRGDPTLQIGGRFADAALLMLATRVSPAERIADMLKAPPASLPEAVRKWARRSSPHYSGTSVVSIFEICDSLAAGEVLIVHAAQPGGQGLILLQGYRVDRSWADWCPFHPDAPRRVTPDRLQFSVVDPRGTFNPRIGRHEDRPTGLLHRLSARTLWGLSVRAGVNLWLSHDPDPSLVRLGHPVVMAHRFSTYQREALSLGDLRVT